MRLTNLNATTVTQLSVLSALETKLRQALEGAVDTVAAATGAWPLVGALQEDVEQAAHSSFVAGLGPRVSAMELLALFLQDPGASSELTLAGTSLWLDICPPGTGVLETESTTALEAQLDHGGQRLLHFNLGAGIHFGTPVGDSVGGMAASWDALYVVGRTLGAVGDASSYGSYDVYITRLTLTAEIVWMRQLGTIGEEQGSAVAVTDNSVYVAGSTTSAFPTFKTAGGPDAFVARYSPSGDLIWVRQFGSNNADRVAGVAANEDAVFLVGLCFAALPDNTFMGGSDLFVASYSAVGDRRWIHQVGTSANDVAYGVALGSDAVFIVGLGGGTIDGEIYGGGSSDILVARFTLEGNKTWTRLLGGQGRDIGFHIAVSADAVFVTGSSSHSLPGATTYFGGDRDMVVARFSMDGIHAWTTQLGSTLVDDGQALAVHAGSVFVTGDASGAFEESQRFGGGKDVFVARLDASNGSYIASRLLGTVEDDFSRGIAVVNETLYLSGYTFGSLFAEARGVADGFLAAIDLLGACWL